MQYLIQSKSLISSAALAAALLTASAHAGHRGNEAVFTNNFVDYARVVSASPLYETVVRQEPSESCWNERVQRSNYGHRGYGHGHRYRGENTTPVLIGALLGGALGNELGHHKRNKQVGAVLGGLLGGSIARDIARDNARDSARRYANAHEPHYETVQRCETTYHDVREQQLVGYDVSYRYRGQIYQTQTAEDPGKRLRLQVSFSPAQ